MPHDPISTTVVGSYPYPGWLELCGLQRDELGPADLAEAVRDAVTVAVHDQVRAGLDVISDGEQGRFDFNLSFYAYLEGLELQEHAERRLGPPAHDQRGRHTIVGELRAPRGLGVVEEFELLQSIAPPGPALQAAVPGPYTLAGRIVPGGGYPDRWAVAEALVPVVRADLVRLADAGCIRIQVDEPSMSCYAYREDTARLADLFNRTVDPVVGRAYLTTHLCFGNYRGRAVARRSYAPMFPDFTALRVNGLHLEMASRELAELELIGDVVAAGLDAVVGVVDVKSYYLETPADVEARIRCCLDYVPAERLAVAPDCGLSQTARWAALPKLQALVEGARRVRATL